MALRIRAIHAPADPRWDAYVRAHPEATPYQLAAWMDILHRAYRWGSASLALEDEDGRLHGVLPLMERRGRIAGARLRSLPAFAAGGPLGDRPEDAAALLERACEIAEEGGLHLTVTSRYPALGRISPRLAASPLNPTWVLEIPSDPAGREEWLRARSSNLRRGIKRAEKAGVTVREGTSDDDLRAFHRLYLTTMRRHRSFPRSLRQLRAARDLLPEGVFRLFVAEREGRIAAGGVFHAFAGTLDLLYNASDPELLEHRPNHALYHAAMDWAAEHGLRRFDFGPAPPDSSLGEFKRQWGAEEVPLFSYEDARRPSPPPAGASVGGGEDGTDWRRRLLDRAWQRTPLPVTALIGSLGYRWL